MKRKGGKITIDVHTLYINKFCMKKNASQFTIEHELFNSIRSKEYRVSCSCPSPFVIFIGSYCRVSMESLTLVVSLSDVS
jgi:hypothetical protein